MKAGIDVKEFSVRGDKRVRLKDWPTQVKPFCKSKEQYQEVLAEHTRKLHDIQSLLYAHNRYSVLIIFQAMDAGGKDSAIEHVMSGLNPQGCQVYSFKQPSAEDLEHDFLWRTNSRLPERGHIGIFNRSYYEEVLVVRVHPEILRMQKLPDEELDQRMIWEGRYKSIVQMERHLHRNGTRIIKFFLHLSKSEQRKRFIKRIDEPQKNWKFSVADVQERKFWKQYMQAYEECLSSTSTKEAPWHIIPADDKDNARLLISQTVLTVLKSLHMSYPQPDAKRRAELQSIKKLLQK